MSELSRVGSGRVGSGRVGSGRVGSGRVGSGRVGSGQVRSGVSKSITGRVGSGPVMSGAGPIRPAGTTRPVPSPSFQYESHFGPYGGEKKRYLHISTAAASSRPGNVCLLPFRPVCVDRYKRSVSQQHQGRFLSGYAFWPVFLLSENTQRPHRKKNNVLLFCCACT